MYVRIYIYIYTHTHTHTHTRNGVKENNYLIQDYRTVTLRYIFTGDRTQERK